MMRVLPIALLAGLLWAAPVSAQIIDPPGFGVPITAQGTTCATAGACAAFALSNVPSITLQIVGTFSATLQFEGTSDGQTWGAVMAIKLSDGSSASSTTATGQYAVSNAGLQQVRVRCSSFSSGVASVTGVRGYATARWLTPFLSSLTFTNGTALADTSGSGKLLITGTTPMIQLGGTTSSFPALKQSGADLNLRLADDSGNAKIIASSFQYSSGIINNGAGLLIASGPPTSPASCGSSPVVTSSNGSAAFVITGGTGGVATGCSVTMPTTTTGWNCQITNITAAAAHRANVWTVQTASTTTSVTWEYQTVSTGAATAFTASDVFRGVCFGY